MRPDEAGELKVDGDKCGGSYGGEAAEEDKAHSGHCAGEDGLGCLDNHLREADGAILQLTFQDNLPKHSAAPRVNRRQRKGVDDGVKWSPQTLYNIL